MQPIQSIAIPQPCHENWNQMTPVDQGRHCNSCSKTVTDFTAMSNNEIINYFAKRDNVCGRFGEQQLISLNTRLAIDNAPRFSWKKLALAAVITGLFTTAKAQRTITMGKPIMIQSNENAKKVLAEPIDALSVNDPGRIINGALKSTDDGLPIVGGVVRAIKSKTIAITDAYGNFKLDVPERNDTLKLTSIGYIPQKIFADTIRKTSCGFSLKTDTNVRMLSGVVGGIIVKRAPFYKLWWYKLKRAF